MSKSEVNQGRRNFLIGATTVVGGVGAIGAAVPFVASWNPSARAKAAGAPVKVDLSKIEPGQQITVEWRGKPVWVVRRTAEMLESLERNEGRVADPNSDEPQQPEYARNQARSRKPEFLILVGLCTHFGCSPTFRPEVAPDDLGKDWIGGFFCPCHGSRFDMAGRVYKSVPAPTNLEVPPYSYLSDSTIVIGVDEESA